METLTAPELDTCTATNHLGEVCDAFYVHGAEGPHTFPADQKAPGLRPGIPAPKGFGEGNGSGSRPAVRLVSDKMVSYLGNLIAAAGLTEEAALALVDTAGTVNSIAALPMARGSELIDLLKNAAPAPAAPTGYRWTKVSGEWFVTGPAAEVGDEIVIRKASGEEAPATITGVRADGLFTVRKGHAAPAPTAPAVEIVHRAVYVTADGQFVKAQKARGRDHFYGKVWSGGEWIYDGAAILGRIVRPITAEEAATWGHDHGACVFCARELTDDGPARSVEVGYGPKCAAKYGLPWGE